MSAYRELQAEMLSRYADGEKVMCPRCEKYGCPYDLIAYHAMVRSEDVLLSLFIQMVEEHMLFIQDSIVNLNAVTRWNYETPLK